MIEKKTKTRSKSLNYLLVILGFLISLTIVGAFLGMPLMEAGANDKPLDINGFYGV